MVSATEARQIRHNTLHQCQSTSKEALETFWSQFPGLTRLHFALLATSDISNQLSALMKAGILHGIKKGDLCQENLATNTHVTVWKDARGDPRIFTDKFSRTSSRPFQVGHYHCPQSALKKTRCKVAGSKERLSYGT